MDPFRSDIGRRVFQRYQHEGCETWPKLARTLAHDVCGGLLPQDTIDAIERLIRDMWFIPGGRYLYYAGRDPRYYNNCFLCKAETDTREEWAVMAQKATGILMTGGGFGYDYSAYRHKGAPLRRTGGIASGPLPAMELVNEIGRRVQQGGSRRSAIIALLNREHPDIHDFIAVKDWGRVIPNTNEMTFADAKQVDFDFPCPLDHTNISVNYGDEWLGSTDRHADPVFRANVEQALRTGEPGFGFNFGANASETLRNPCGEVVSADDSDVCNLGSMNLSRIPDLDSFREAVGLATAFLLCGTIRAHLPYAKVYDVREKNRRLGLGLMGVHEWLLQRGSRYEVTPELHQWLAVYRDESRAAADDYAEALSVSRPVACRAIAPTGTIGMLAGTTTGIEPIFAVAYKRRYLKGDRRHFQYVVESPARVLIDQTGVNPDAIETSLDLAKDYRRRIKFQADVQDYVDMAISSTINLPEWGSELNNPAMVDDFALTLAEYAPRLRGFTCYPNGARGGQPLTPVPYAEAIKHKDKEYVEGEDLPFTESATDICSLTGGGVCGS